MPPGPLCLGIDFGTSSSAVAAWVDGEVRALRIAGAPLQRTLFFLPDDSHERGAIVLGNAAATAYSRDRVPGRMIQSVKAHLPSSIDELLLGGARVAIEALIGFFLRFLREEAAIELGVPVEALSHVVLGRPVRFHVDPVADARAERRLLRAARLAGFTAVAFQFEPVAAALDHERTVPEDELVVVGDLGGGTSDFAVVRVGPGRGLHDRGRDVLATSGIPLAGNALDRDVLRRHVLAHFGGDATYRRVLSDQGGTTPWRPHLLDSIVDLPRAPLLRSRRNEEYLRRMEPLVEPKIVLNRLHDLIFGGLSFPVAEAVERAKIALTDTPETRIRFAEETIQLDAPLSRTAFEETTADTVQRIVATLDEALQRAGVRADQVSRAFLTGGTSQVPALRRVFEQRFGGRVVVGSLYTSVATGLARSWPLAFDPEATRRVQEIEAAPEPPAPRACVHVEHSRVATVAALHRQIQGALLQPAAALSIETLAWLYGLAAAPLPDPLRGALAAWRARASAEIAAFPDDSHCIVFLETLEDAPAESIPHALRDAVAALLPGAGPSATAILRRAQEQWEETEPTLPPIPADPVPVSPRKSVARTAAPSTPKVAVPEPIATTDAQIERARHSILARLTGLKEGLRESILLDSVCRPNAEFSLSDARRALAQLTREKRIRVAGGRWVKG